MTLPVVDGVRLPLRRQFLIEKDSLIPRMCRKCYLFLIINLFKSIVSP